MEDLRQTAFAYYKHASTDDQRLVDEFFYEMDLDENDRVSLQEFTEYMERHGDYKHLCNSLFSTKDMKSLISWTGRPFCNGQCKKFIKGVYFACVKCYDDYATDATNTFNVCPACYADGKYGHGHDKFLDSFLLLQSKRMTSVTNESKALQYGSTSETSNSSSPAPEAPPAPPAPDAPPAPPAPPRPLTPHTSNAMVPVNPRPNNSAGRKALKTIEVLLALGNIFAATQCTIM
ncbi:hypothetical protein C1H46_004778 [Malus baccata]|uniref:EF-hand domain-containing protein n=1 Tax=Malus baccata TaxID=106549 RepID=A0A540NEU8_MALBA|nr:hypothetical protein C1H46_004778 [Malus baccata]